MDGGNNAREEEEHDEEIELGVEEEEAVDDMVEETSEDEALEDDVAQTDHDAVVVDDAAELNGFWERQFRRMARNPRIHFWGAFVIAVVLSVIGLVVGEFEVAANNDGWNSRGTKISDRESQVILVRINRFDLFTGDPEVWDELIENVQPGWETDDDEVENDVSRMLQEAPELPPSPSSWHSMIEPKLGPLSEQAKHEFVLPFQMSEDMNRRLQLQADTGLLAGCDLSWYNSSMAQDTHVWSIWKTKKSENTALDPELILDLCEAEEKTQETLIKNNLCLTCESGGCLHPYGLVFYARLTVPNGFALNCEELSAAWAPYQEPTEAVWPQCVEDVRADFDADSAVLEIPDSCPFGFYPSLLDESFDSTNRVEYTSSIFATIDDVDALFEEVSSFDRGSKLVAGVYDTPYEDFVDIQIDNSLTRDMALALGSAAVTALAILAHTRSPFLTLIGIVQIVLSFPLAYFVYTFIARLEFFPFLNFIGIFVVFALGADDVFVAVDKWKNARIKHWDASTEFVAAKALPDAAGAMFLTTITTAVAFFGTAICPVAPILCFAVFCGLLIIFDYVMCVVLVFPALVMYDNTRHRTCCCMRCHYCKRCEAKGLHGEEDDERPSLIRRILLKFYDILHKIRWPLLVACMGGLAVSIYFATQLELPESSDVRLLDADDFQYELHYEWRLKLLYDVLIKEEGSQTYIIWGTKPADTGDPNNPDSFTQLVLDDTFDPSSEDVQVYLQGFCDKLFEQDFAEKSDVDYQCSINEFDEWLQEQAASDSPDDDYTNNCGGATGLPVAQENFDACIIAWSQQQGFVPVLARDGVVEIMYMSFNAKVRYDSPYDDLDDEWHKMEDWLENERVNVAPVGVQRMYHSSEDFWWYDTNGQMLRTAYGAAAIALGMAGAVILFSSRSLVLTFFSVFTIAFILTSVTALLVGFDWTLGFLESICFAILIGISCDFVIHFSHAYAALPGKADRGTRTKHALILMGPSILAAAFTTIAAAIIMLFTVITFFEKFAVILFLTIVMSTVGSFVVFITLADCIGPTQPTYLMDKLAARCSKRCNRNTKSGSETEDLKEVSSDEEGQVKELEESSEE